MTAGALIFAHNNDKIDYISMAKWSAKNIERHLKIPTIILTDVCTDSTNSRWFNDYQCNMVWFNQSRVSAFELSPWDRTLVLDADYVVASDQLGVLLQSQESFMCFRKSFDLTGTENFAVYDSFGAVNMPMWWATVMCFDKTHFSEMIFKIMDMVQKNWTHFRSIYQIKQTTYRNDFALSIALNLAHGQTLQASNIPWSMATLMPQHKIKQTDLDCYQINFSNNEQKSFWIDIQGQDFHAMGKQQLGEIIANSS